MIANQPVRRQKISSVLFADLNTIYFKCPACKIHHAVQVLGKEQPVWQWDQNAELPTFKPSIRVRSHNAAGPTCCHLFVTQGKLQFLDDCTHDLKGKTVDMIPVMLTSEPLK